MFLLLRRYLPTLVVISFTTACLWTALIIYTDGLWPVLGGALWLLSTLLTVPIMVWLDFHEMRTQMKEIRAALRSDGSLASTKAVENLLGLVGNKVGVPDGLLGGALKLAEEKVRARQTAPCD